MAKSTIRKLFTFIKNLRRKRLKHLKVVERIDALFAEMGLSSTEEKASPPAKRRGRPPKSGRRRGRPAGRRKDMKSRSTGRGAARKGRTGHRFPVSGPQSLLNLVNHAGAEGVTSAQIQAHWRSEGRRGAPYPELNKLVKGGQLKKKSRAGVRGSVYSPS